MAALSRICCCTLLLLGFCTPATAQAQAVNAAAQRVTLALSTEPPSLNSLESTDQISSLILGHVQEGLLRYDAQGQLVGGVAERWEVSADSARFWLRRNARWSDGKPVTAHDFVFAWRQVLKPETASQYAFLLYPIRNAEAINRGELPADALGVRALDDHELVVDLAQPTPYFHGLTAFMSYFPVREDFFHSRGSRYAATADDLLYNGPFVLSRWVQGAQLVLQKNPQHWDAASVRLNTIDFAHITSDTQAVFNLFRNGSIAMTGLSRDFFNTALELGYPLRQFSNGAVFFVQFNYREGRETASLKLRQAIQAVFDPSVLVNRVLAVPGITPAYSLFPRFLQGVQKPLLEEYPPRRIDYSLAEARRLMREYLAERGLDKPPVLTLLTSDSAIGVQQAEYLQYLLRTALGLELRIDRQIFKLNIEKMRNGEFDLVFAGWGPDFNDPMTFADLFSSWNDNNRGRYASTEYDHWVRVAQSTIDPVLRTRAFAELQRILVDEAVILPMYESASTYTVHPQLKGVARSLFSADPNLRDAWVDDAGTTP